MARALALFLPFALAAGGCAASVSCVTDPTRDDLCGAAFATAPPDQRAEVAARVLEADAALCLSDAPGVEAPRAQLACLDAAATLLRLRLSRPGRLEQPPPGWFDAAPAPRSAEVGRAWLLLTRGCHAVRRPGAAPVLGTLSCALMTQVEAFVQGKLGEPWGDDLLTAPRLVCAQDGVAPHPAAPPAWVRAAADACAMFEAMHARRDEEVVGHFARDSVLPPALRPEAAVRAGLGARADRAAASGDLDRLLALPDPFAAAEGLPALRRALGDGYAEAVAKVSARLRTSPRRWAAWKAFVRLADDGALLGQAPVTREWERWYEAEHQRAEAVRRWPLAFALQEAMLVRMKDPKRAPPATSAAEAVLPFAGVRGWQLPESCGALAGGRTRPNGWLEIRVEGACTEKTHERIEVRGASRTVRRTEVTATPVLPEWGSCITNLNGDCQASVRYDTREVTETAGGGGAITFRAPEIAVTGKAVAVVGGERLELPLAVTKKGAEASSMPDFKVVGAWARDAIGRQVMAAIEARALAPAVHAELGRAFAAASDEAERADLAIACRWFGGPCHGAGETVPGFSDEDLRELNVIPAR